MYPIAISPCPNDTFLFHAWIEGIVGEDLRPTPTFGDIEHLNKWSEENKFPLIKVSLAKFAGLQDRYELLPVGCALGWNCGPKLISHKDFALKKWSEATVAIPGKETTAHHLMLHFLGEPKAKVFCLYHEVESLIHAGRVDAGLIIHETRFTHQCMEVADFGTLWHEKYHLPLPLGGLIIEKGSPLKERVTAILRESLSYAWEKPHISSQFILKHSIIKESDVVNKHIALYVNEETHTLSSNGLKAVELLLKLCSNIAESQTAGCQI